MVRGYSELPRAAFETLFKWEPPRITVGGIRYLLQLKDAVCGVVADTLKQWKLEQTGIEAYH